MRSTAPPAAQAPPPASLFSPTPVNWGSDEVLRHDSIIGTTFLGRVVSHTDAGVVTEVQGSAYRTGAATFTLDPNDPLNTGFTLR